MIKTIRDLRHNFGPIRDQHDRPTCLAFAASDAHAAVRSGWAPLSVEYMYYHAQHLSGLSSSQGCYLPDVLEVLKTKGQPVEQNWPYQTNASVSAAWTRPTDCGELYRRRGELIENEVENLIASLESGIPMLVLLNVSMSFFAPGKNAVVDFTPTDPPNPEIRHAVVATAIGECDGTLHFLIRNSWGSRWGDGGHAWLTESYIRKAVFAYAALKGEADGESTPRAA